MTYPDLSKRDLLIQGLAESEDSTQSHAIFQLSDKRVDSLASMVEERLSGMSEAPRTIIHVIGLENTPLFDVLNQQEDNWARLENEGSEWLETLKPSLIFWLDTYNDNLLKEQAPSLYQAISSHFSLQGSHEQEEQAKDYAQVREWVTGDKENFEASLGVVRLLSSRGMLQVALNLGEELAAQDLDDREKAEVYSEIGKILERQHNFAQAITAYETGLATAKVAFPGWPFKLPARGHTPRNGRP